MDSPLHLCGILSPCCIEKLSGAIVRDIFIAIAKTYFTLAIIVSIMSIIIDIFIWFTKTPESSLGTSKEIPKREISNLFQNNSTIPEYKFNFV
jgi:hypothetical protein